ncbi:MAG: AAA family ATPase [Pseudomonadota bacterium]|nr:AAA family ATPase [Pseudomonadota bacterium]
MIIRSLEAENLLKYKTLRLNELPARGVIAVSGDNDTGKSAIGEIICFALFGRTYALTADDLDKLVRWGAGRGSVTLAFSTKDHDYELTRHLDREGEQSARLVRDNQPQEPLARGAEAVGAHMQRILGYDFDQYVETFYLAQREIAAPHPHSPAVKTMAGVVNLERCAQEFRQEIAQEEDTIRSLEGVLSDVDGKLALLGSDHERLDELEQELEEASVNGQEVTERVEGLTAAADAYSEACKGLRGHEVRRGLSRLLLAFLLLAIVGVVGIGALLHFKPNLWPLSLARERLDGFFASTNITLDAALVYTVIALAGILVLIWLWSFALSLGARRRRARGRRLAEELERIDDLEPGAATAEPPVSEDALDALDALDAGAHGIEAPPLVDKPDSERRARLGERALRLAASPEEVRAAVQHETAWMRRRGEELEGRRELLEETLENARSDYERSRTYRGQKEEAGRQLVSERERLATRRLACELLDGAALQMSQRFRDRLRVLVSRSLPLFTDGRYEQLELDDELQVRVLSNEKRDFLDLVEISSGTQRQIMLALRLALSDELVARAVKDRQFGFLDEPFAFFDDARMRGALEVLPALSEDIGQYWIVAQRFPEDPAFALEIACGAHPDTLEVGGPPAG